jgi:triphosphoribosyl-dephospho-CoA synthase
MHGLSGARPLPPAPAEAAPCGADGVQLPHLQPRLPARLPARAPSAGNPNGKQRRFCARIGLFAVRSLYAELSLYPKPGLVSLLDNGSHQDMSADTFMRSMFALRHYFVRITLAGAQGAPFSTLAALGIEAEQRMLVATGGVNTHRGAVFGLGLLCAALGACHAASRKGTPVAISTIAAIPTIVAVPTIATIAAISAADIRAALVSRWGAALAAHARPGAADSHGTLVAQRYAVGGARQEAALGMPAVFEVALPALRGALAAGRGPRRARIDALFALMAHISDTNVYHRGGADGARIVQQQARAFLAAGGTAAPDWEARALACHRMFVAGGLSPGGAADLLAAACLVHSATRGGA